VNLSLIWLSAAHPLYNILEIETDVFEVNMSLRSILFYIFIVFTASSLAQGESGYLTIISLEDNDKLNQLENLEVPVYHYIDSSLLTVLNKSKLDKVDNLLLDYRVLDEKIKSDKYYLITAVQPLNVSDHITGENIVFQNDRLAIVKNIKESYSQLLSKGLKAVRLKGTKVFKNQKMVARDFKLMESDSLISQIISGVNQDSIRYYIQNLQDFVTRYRYASTRDSVAGWIKTQFIRWGYVDVVIDSFEYNSTWQKNVIATLPGTDQPDVVNIVGGHHDSDSFIDPMVAAPGADDNASGSAAVLEMARVLKEINYQPESTIKFMTFAAEEGGLLGSEDYALKAFNSNMDIKIMINHDMISHTYSPLANSNVDINYYTGFEYLRELAMYCTETYSLITPQNGSVNSAGSDSYSFWEMGFPSVYFEERDFSPFYHSPEDTIGNYSMEFCAEVIKSSFATLLTSIVVPSNIKNYSLVDRGDGSSLLLSWSPNVESDLQGYRIYFGTSSGNYDTLITTVDTTYVLDGLNEGTIYYVGVSAFDVDGNESIVVERSAVPKSLPLAPAGFTALAQWHKVELYWYANFEFDLLGYNLYRSDTEGELGDKLNNQILTDTTYLDNDAAIGVYYYYTVKAVDDLLNESEDNVTLRSRVVSLDQGILIVDETADGDGSPMNPTDEQVDEFYNKLLSHFKSEEYDILEEGGIGLADLGAYSTILWHGNDDDDLSAPFQSRQSIKEFLDFGGNFLYTGYRPSTAFEQVFGLLGSFDEGDFIYDYLKISETTNKILALFYGAKGITGSYNDIFIDSSKTLPANQYHLKTIESTQPNTAGISIYTYETMYDSISPQGILKGEPVGVEYIGTDFKTVVISYPLYYMKQQEAKDFVEYVLNAKFDEAMPVEKEGRVTPDKYALKQNYPNPFNPVTKIKYEISELSFVSIKVYNVLGNEITTLVSEEKLAGSYETTFDASSAYGGLPSGIYFYTIKAGNFTQTKKMVLLK
jgi:hypothetical protein